jgi:opacity protein-like surface antigen
MKTTRGALLAGAAAVALLAAGQAAYALEGDPYFSIAGGLNFVPPMTLNSTTSPLSASPRVLDFDTGVAGSVAAGHSFGGNFRAEGELSFRWNGLGMVTVQGEGTATLNSGSVAAFGIMANGWFDIPTATRVTPYVGGGVGAARVSLKMDTDVTGAPCSCQELDISASDWALAYQLGAGVAVGLHNGATLTFDYRFFGTGGLSLPYTGTSTGTATTRYTAHSAMIGLRVPIHVSGN